MSQGAHSASISSRMTASWCCFDTAEEQALSLAKDIAEQLKKGLQESGRASVAFSGGSTPKRMLQLLAEQSLDWSKVFITLVDERCVGVESSRSNARLLQENLLERLDLQPQFYPLYLPQETLEQLQQRFVSFLQPFDVVHLGMGADAHTASFFPDANNIDDMLDINGEAHFLNTCSESSREQRITWTLPSLLRTQAICLQISGQTKRQVLDSALEKSVSTQDGRLRDRLRKQMPIVAVIERTQLVRTDGTPLSIYYTD